MRRSVPAAAVAAVLALTPAAALAQRGESHGGGAHGDGGGFRGAGGGLREGGGAGSRVLSAPSGLGEARAYGGRGFERGGDRDRGERDGGGRREGRGFGGFGYEGFGYGPSFGLGLGYGIYDPWYGGHPYAYGGPWGPYGYGGYGGYAGSTPWYDADGGGGWDERDSDGGYAGVSDHRGGYDSRYYDAPGGSPGARGFACGEWVWIAGESRYDWRPGPCTAAAPAASTDRSAR